MLQRWKGYISPGSSPASEAGGGDGRWRWVKASVCGLLVLSFVFVSCSAVAYGPYRWRYPDCTQVAFTAGRLSGAAPAASPSPAADSPTNLSHILFGIGGSAATWHRRRGYTELWWRPGEMRGHVWLDALPSEPWPAATCPPYKISSGDASRFGPRASAARIARIVAESYRLGLEGVRWYVMGDDDTVFFPENLVAALRKYDPGEMWYVGAASESVEQNVLHSYGMAFGGGGFAVSAPAAAELAGAIDGCLERYAYFYGSDQRVHSCFAELGVPLTREPAFHQVDLRGDAYGMLAAHPVAPLVSLHHLGHLQPISPQAPTQLDAVRSLVSASRFDPARTLQQAFCYERGREYAWSISVSWGYTVQLYPWVLAPKDLEVPLRTFQTWRSFSDGPFTFNTRPYNPAQPCERPLLFFLDRVKEGKRGRDGTNTTESEYSRSERNRDENGCNRPGFGAASRVAKVNVFAPVMDPDVWRRAPRRQCCKTRRRRWGRTMDVDIHYCRPGELTSPP